MPDSPYELFLSKFEEFTEIQKLSIGPIEQGENCVITAPTGSGKTEAAILPVLNKISKGERKDGVIAI
jgi:ATP-dependent Lhr-like helicase